MMIENGLPSGWCWSTIGALAVSMKNGIYKEREYYADAGTPCLRMYNIDDGKLILQDLKYLTLSKEEIQEYGLAQGDLLVNRVNSRELVGKACVIPEGLGSLVFESKNIRLRIDASVADSRFLNYRLLCAGRAYFNGNAQQTVGMASVNQEQLGNLPVPLPPLHEQRRIATVIDELFSDLDAGVTALERARANLKRYRAAVLKAAVEGRLTEQWRAAHPATEPAPQLLARILAERRRKWEANQLAKYAAAGRTPPKDWRAKYVEPTPPETNGLPELPRAWCWGTVEQVSEFARYGSGAKASSEAQGVPVLRMGNIHNGSLDLTDLKYLPADHDEFPDLLLREGDLLFNRTNSAELVGKSAVYLGVPSTCSYASYLIGVRCLRGCDSRFLCCFLNSAYGRRWVGSVVSQQVGQANVNGTKLQALTFPIPPEDEQAQIVADLEERLSDIDAAEAQIETNLQRAARLRQSILKRAFEGKLVPQDPTDEPARVLLERIEQQRASSVNGEGGKIKTRRKRRDSGTPTDRRS
jgi:type I restriction enzyme S subunit